MDYQHFEKLNSYIPDHLNLFSIKGFLLSMLVLSGFIVFRYFLMVLPFHLLRKNSKSALPLKPEQITREIKYSLISTFFFSFSGYLVGLLWQNGQTQLYLEFNGYGLIYLLLSFFIYAFLHELYFYFTHVAMHKPYLYQKIHKIHHLSNPTSPWASFSFHPYECVIHALFLPLMVLFIPIHPVVLIGYLTFMTLTAIFNHLGFEIFPYQFLNNHFISGTHHGLHHKYYNGNYGLYFCFMDRIMKTELAHKK